MKHPLFEIHTQFVKIVILGLHKLVWKIEHIQQLTNKRIEILEISCTTMQGDK